jgi:hypothetical protein
MHQAGVWSVLCVVRDRFMMVIRSANASVATPEAYRQGSHKEGMSTEIGRHCKVGIKEGGSTCLLKLGQIGSFPPNKRQE